MRSPRRGFPRRGLDDARVVASGRSPGAGVRQTISLNSFDARNATFLLALILIASPVAGFRPMRAARLRTTKMPRQDHAFARVGGQHYDEASANLANVRTREFLRNNLG